ncbi:MAG: response regulator [Pseudomonadota bacterium]
MQDFDTYLKTRQATASRPLLGQTILVVEDSRFACETLRLMCLRSGARIRMADSMRSARRHLKVYRPSVLIVDMGLPDGSGADLLLDLTQATPRVDVIIGTSGDPDGEQTALDAGADGFLHKPLGNLGAFQASILELMPVERRPRGPRPVTNEHVIGDEVAYQCDMAHMADLLNDPEDPETLDYVAQFLTGVAHAAGDAELENAARALGENRKEFGSVFEIVGQISALVHARMQGQIAI